MLWLGLAALIVSAISLIVAFLARRDSSRSAQASERSAKAAEQSAATAQEVDRRARTPQLDLILTDPSPPPTDRVIYKVRNDGPQDLEDIVIYRPRLPNQIIYPVAVTGSDWAEDDIHLGPIVLGQEMQFTFCCGAAPELPEFRVRIECHSENESWEMTRLLPPPRG